MTLLPKHRPAPASAPPPVAVPTEVRLSDARTTVTVTWHGPATGVVQYALLAGPAGTPPTVQRMLGHDVHQATVGGLDPTTDYCFQVAAVYPAALGRSATVCTSR